MLISKSALLSFALTAGFAQAVAEECTRQALTAARDQFWEAGKAGSQPPNLGKSVKIALNNKPETSLSSTPFSHIKTASWTAFNVQALDTELCEIATFKVSSQMLLSTRLKLDPASNTLTEVEFLQAVSGDQFFRPSGFPREAPAMFNEKQTPSPPPQVPSVWTPAEGMFIHREAVSRGTCKAKTGTPRPWTRRELIYATSSYTDGLKGEPFASCVFSGSSCPRNENGVTTTQNCGVGTGMFGFTVQGRRWVADTETGVVLGVFFFNYSNTGSNLFLHEYFKVSKGALAYIFAPMKNIPHAQAAAKTFTQEPK